jgi:hypothetical protein
VFEKLPLAGGMMAVGIPEYRLPRNQLAIEIRVIEKMGVEIKTGVAFGKDIILVQNYQAIPIKESKQTKLFPYCIRASQMSLIASSFLKNLLGTISVECTRIL